MVTEGQRIEKKGRAKKTEVFAQLVEAAQRLVAVAMACKEQSNQRLRRFTSEIELLMMHGRTEKDRQAQNHAAAGLSERSKLYFLTASPFASASAMRRYISCICRSISAIFSAQANISSSMPAGSFARSAL